MRLPNIKILFRLTSYFTFFVLPVFGMMNCWGNEAVGIQGCHVNFLLARYYAGFYFGLVLFSAFMLLIPLVIYILIVFWLTEVAIRAMLGRVDRSSEVKVEIADEAKGQKR